MRGGVKVFLCLAFLVLFLALVHNFIKCYRYVEISESYPAFDVHARHYHSTKEIHSGVRLDNALNPFYAWFDLSPTVDALPMKIYGYGPSDENINNYTLRVFILCNQHAREVVTGELCYQLIRLIQLQTRDDHFTVSLKQQVLDGVGYWIVPVGNPWGRQLVESNVSHGCQRVNINGVDLNRNFPSVHARPYMSDNAEEHPGDEPFSEYETQSIAAFADFVQPHLVLNIHSGGNDILLPFDGDDAKLPPLYTRLLKFAAHARKGICPECSIGSASIIYPPADGTFVDYMIVNAETPLAYTLEIYESPDAKQSPRNGEECRRFFNPSEGDELAYTLRKWTAIILRLTEKISSLVKR